MKKGFKHSIDTRRRLSASAKRREKNGMQGKKHTSATIEKMRLAKLGKKRPPMSAEWRSKVGQKGEKNHFWRGGIYPEHRRIRNTVEYRLWREAIFERDNYTCVWCGLRSAKGVKAILNADHIKPFAHYPELRFALDNGRSLCIECHKKTDTYLVKSRWAHNN